MIKVAPRARQRRTRHIPIIPLTGFPDRAVSEGAWGGRWHVSYEPCRPDDPERHVALCLCPPGRPWRSAGPGL